MTTNTITRERSICLTDTEVRGLIDGTLTEIRRPIKPQPDSRFKSFGELPTCQCHPYGFHDGERHWACPFGEPGTVLVGKEAWTRAFPAEIYRADYNVADGFGAHSIDLWTGKTCPTLWKSGACMPRKYARFRLVNAGVRVERSEGVWMWVVAVKRIEGQP